MFNFFSKQKILEEYIKKCLSENFPKEQIRDKLRNEMKLYELSSIKISIDKLPAQKLF